MPDGGGIPRLARLTGRVILQLADPALKMANIVACCADWIFVSHGRSLIHHGVESGGVAMENVNEAWYVQAEGQRLLVRCFDPVTQDVIASWPGDLSGGVDRRLLHRAEYEPDPPRGLPLANRWQPLHNATNHRLIPRPRRLAGKRPLPIKEGASVLSGETVVLMRPGVCRGSSGWSRLRIGCDRCG